MTSIFDKIEIRLFLRICKKKFDDFSDLASTFLQFMSFDYLSRYPEIDCNKQCHSNSYPPQFRSASPTLPPPSTLRPSRPGPGRRREMRIWLPDVGVSDPFPVFVLRVFSIFSSSGQNLRFARSIPKTRTGRPAPCSLKYQSNDFINFLHRSRETRLCSTRFQKGLFFIFCCI